MSFISVNNVWQRYGDQVVLEGLNLQVAEGEFCTLVGTSGCGKSTFLRLLLGQETASKGQILLDGQPLAAEPDASRGVVFQRYSVFPHLSVLDNVVLGLELPRAPLCGRLFGQAQREAREQAAVLLDEPFGALDPGIRKDMHQLLLELWRETRLTVFMVTHDLSEGFSLGTRLLVFDKVRVDPHAPGAYGARITYDIPLNSERRKALAAELGAPSK